MPTYLPVLQTILSFFYQNTNEPLPIRHMKKILSKALEKTSLKTLIFPGERRHMKSRLVKEAKKIIPYIPIRSEDYSDDTESDSVSDSDPGHEIESESDPESESDSESESDLESESDFESETESDFVELS